MIDMYLKSISLTEYFQTNSTFQSAFLWTSLSFLFFLTLRIHQKSISTKIRLGFFILNFVLMQFSMLISLMCWIKFSLNISPTPLALDNIFNLGWLGMLTIFIHIILTGLFWKLSVETYKNILILEPRLKHRILFYFLVSSAISIPFFYNSLHIPVIGIFLFCLTSSLLMDLFIEGQYKSLTWTLTWVLYFAFFHTQLIYKFTLEREWKEMKYISEKLAKLRDEKMTIELAELNRNKFLFEHLEKINDAWKNGELSDAEYQTNIERELKPSPYLLKYYKISFLSGKNEILPHEDNQFFLSPDYGISIALKKDDNTSLLFSLKSGESNRLNSLMAGNYMETPNLESYLVYIFYQNNLLFKQGRGGLEEQELAGIQSKRPITKMISSKQMILTLNKESGLRIIMSKRLGGYAKPLAYFSFTSCISLLLYYLYVWFLLFKKNINTDRNQQNFKSFGSSIQKSLFYLTFSAFCILSISTLFYFNKSRQLENEKIKWFSAKEILSTFQRRYHGSESQLLSISKQHGYDMVYLNEDKKLIKSFSTDLPGDFPALKFNKDIQQIKKEEIRWKGLDLLRVWYPVQLSEDKTETTWLGIYFPDKEKKLSHDAADFIGALLSGYLFLLLSISAITIYMTHTLTHPLDQLGKHLGNLRIETNEKISWHKNDEVGQLVNAYNRAITALKESTATLRKSEREHAWREMAKQVAHEIKNPLTPMKLSLQYLQRAGIMQPEIMHTLLPNLTATIMEQINTLDQIATSFSQFATMPDPEKIPFNLAELVEKTIELYSHQMGVHHLFHYSSEESSYQIFADRHQIQRVINNLLNNAIQAIPPEKEGKIVIRLFQLPQHLVRLEIDDNGKGVENETHQKIFSPYFTTKSSGTGLGLAMCKDIIENSGGKIGFNSNKNKGTCFWIEIPLYHQNSTMQSRTAIMSFAS